jgi:putative selenate reductase
VAHLTPIPFGALVTRMFRGLETRQAIFDLPVSAVVRPEPGLDWAVSFHGRRVATPFGPAAGPHTQLAQNIVLSWLAGGRILELKTVQVNDRIAVARPCIDMRTVGFNVEWSQELTLEQSLEEYVKASMLIEMLAASGRLELPPGFERFAFDLSVGYDFAGITSARVQAFIHGMRDARPTIDRLRREIPAAWREHADLPFVSRVASSVTLSTFHGCPPSEIARTAGFLLRDMRLATVVKLNPTLLGYDDTRRLLHDELGYGRIRLAGEAFDEDLQWDDMCAMVDRLARTADDEGLGFGVKLTNTLVVENEGNYLPASEPRKYMSGPPLHVLAMQLVARFRREFGLRVPLSFSGGIDALNLPDAVALGLTPVTVCTDLLKTGGYARGQKYFRELARRMKAVGARTVPEFIERAYRGRDTAGIERPDDASVLRNTACYVAALAADPRYGSPRHARPPRKIGRELRLFDCLSCDKCVPVCPNDANFAFVLPAGEIPRATAWRDGDGWHVREDVPMPVVEAHQIATFADACNDCGNCDVFCPEDGGPYHVKPRFFGSEDTWLAAAPADGFCLERIGVRDVMRARIGGDEYLAEFTAGRVRYSGTGFDLAFDAGDIASTVRGESPAPVDLSPYYLMTALRDAVLAVPGGNFVNCVVDAAGRKAPPYVTGL